MREKNLFSFQLNKNYYKFSKEVCGEAFKIQSGPLNCNSEKVLYLFEMRSIG